VDAVVTGGADSDDRYVLGLDDPRADLSTAGGKGASLARLAAAGLPVPSGFHVTTAAYRRFVDAHNLAPRIRVALEGDAEEASRRIWRLFAAGDLPGDVTAAIRRAYRAMGGERPVAVRSSATAEDLPDRSFAGQQDTFLNVRGEAPLLVAVRRCWASLWTARAIEYRARAGAEPEAAAMSVVVQELVPAEAAGVLFTADPVTGDPSRMLVDAAWGMGESIAGGDVNPDTLVLDAATGEVLETRIGEKAAMTVPADRGTRRLPVPRDRRAAPVLDAAQAAALADLGRRVAALDGRPMDIEWARRDGTLSLLQARPITAAGGPIPDPAEWNDSLSGDFLWSSANLGEAIPDVMTPCTWSLVRIFMSHAMATASLPTARGYGIVGGRFYMNLSVAAAISGAIGIGRARFASLIEPAFGRLPPGLAIPPVRLPRLRLLWDLVRAAVGVLFRVRSNLPRLEGFVAGSPARCAALRAEIAATDDPARLGELWRARVLPLLATASDMLEAATRGDPLAVLGGQRRLARLVGEEDATALTSGAGGSLASLGPVIGLAELARGEIDRDTYARRWGHRGPHEFEVSEPRPAERPDWPDRELAGLAAASADPLALLKRQEEASAAAWERLVRDHPDAARSARRRLDRWTAAARRRESARSEVVRVFWVLRAFVLRAGELTGHGGDLFFLEIDEALAVLRGDAAPLARVPGRRGAYERYRALPTYPTLIRGRFDPVRWAADPDRRVDLFDETRDLAPVSETVSGYAGASGVVEGTVRRIERVEDADALRAGEVLVTTVTNVGWTPIFPRAAAVVTDIGAPLSHAAIVARELGIPAVVGCGNATMRLHTGDRVRVDGARGVVEKL
jgi:rifampicin phosphotransferase